MLWVFFPLYNLSRVQFISIAVVLNFKVYYPLLQNKNLAFFFTNTICFSKELRHSLILLHFIIGRLKLIVEKIQMNQTELPVFAPLDCFSRYKRAPFLNSYSLYVNYFESPFENWILDDCLARNLALYTLSICCLQLVEIQQKASPISTNASSTKLRWDSAEQLIRSLARLWMQYLSEGIDWFFFFFCLFPKTSTKQFNTEPVLLGDVQLFFHRKAMKHF